MTDMRATERLLEVIEEQASEIRDFMISESEITASGESIVAAITELRRRGDLLVRARDLEQVVQAIGREQLVLGEDEAQALNRLDGALGRVL